MTPNANKTIATVVLSPPNSTNEAMTKTMAERTYMIDPKLMIADGSIVGL